MDSRRGHIFSLYVAPGAGRRGIAKALLQHDLNLLAERGLATVTLWVFEENRAARNLYASFGFEPDGARRVEPQYGAQEIRLRRAEAEDDRGRRREPPGGGAVNRSVNGGTGPVSEGSRLDADLVLDVADDSALARSPAVERLRRYLSSLVSGGFPPSVSLAVVQGDRVVLEAFGGHACLVGELVPTTAGTCYDLASLTKVVCTTTLALIARQRRALDFSDPVARWLPAYPQPRTTLAHLLTHTSGLVDHVPFYATATGRAAIEAALYAEAAKSVPGDDVRYSDLGFMLLGWVLEACLGRSLDEAFAVEVAAPLGLARARFRPPLSERRSTAATELGGDQRPPGGLVWGEVHDGNAFALGGVAGHAGLFAPLGELARFVQSLLSPEPGRALSAESIAFMCTRQAAGAGDVRGTGWRLEPERWGAWPPGTIWHTGFTGTSLLVAPAVGTGVVLLTNGVHPRRRLDDQAEVRAEVHRVLAEALL